MAGRKGKFTYDEIKEMMLLYLNKGYSYRQLAKYYGVHWTTIYKILNVLRYQDVVMKVINDLGFEYLEYMQKKDLINLKNKIEGGKYASKVIWSKRQSVKV